MNVLDGLSTDLLVMVDIIDNIKVREFVMGIWYGLRQDLLHPEVVIELLASRDLFTLMYNYGCEWDGQVPALGPVMMLNNRYVDET